MQSRQRQRRGGKLRALLFAATSICPALGLARGLPREPALLNQRQVERGIDTRLQQMRQRHESSRAVRQAAKLAANRGRAVADTEPALRREPVELSVQPLPTTSD